VYDLDDQRAGAKTPRERESLERAIADEARFIRTLFGNPRLTGAISPSGRFLARAMARAVDPRQPGLVVELGPGTGPVTRALIERGVPADQLALVEYDAAFCRLLAQRFPDVRVIHGDAYRLSQTLAELSDRPIKAVVSSLPLLAQAPARRAALLSEAFAIMGSKGVFVQFTYAVVSPAPLHVGSLHLSATASAPIWLNLPPARVWTYRVAASAPVASKRRLLREAETAADELRKRAKAAAKAFGARRAEFGSPPNARVGDVIEEARRDKPLTLLRNRLTRI
jgi:phosphatidylethanolamine/phosphatidyl-N-methylethanolamine N-methyltransferase